MTGVTKTPACWSISASFMFTFAATKDNID